MNKIKFNIGDLLINDFLKTSKGMPYIIKVYKIDSDNNVIRYLWRGEEHYIGPFLLRKANSFEKIYGPIYDFIFK